MEAYGVSIAKNGTVCVQMRQNGAVISSTRIRSQFQNYIWQLNNISLFLFLANYGNITFHAVK